MYTVCFNMYFGRYHSCHISFTSATISLIGIYLISAPPWKCHPSFNTSGIELIPQALMIHRHLLVPAFPNLIHSNVCNATSAKVCHWLTCYYLSQIFFFFFFSSPFIHQPTISFRFLRATMVPTSKAISENTLLGVRLHGSKANLKSHMSLPTKVLPIICFVTACIWFAVTSKLGCSAILR